MRKAGTILHISSLPSPWGIGTMGKAAYDFADFLGKAGLKVWQILPLVPSGQADSPYASYSTYAGNPYFIDLELLQEDGLLEKREYERLSWGKDRQRVDYRAMDRNRMKVLRLAFERGYSRDLPRVEAFRRENAAWLEDYALYMALRGHFQGKPWMEWDADIREREPEAIARYQRELAEEVHFWTYVQYLFYQQWFELKNYVNAQGIQIMGDIPIYCFLDSVDVWAHRDYFWLNSDNTLLMRAGVPPDAFSEDGQDWGNPLYRWDLLEDDGYQWWIDRIDHACTVHDIIRIDHFRAFDQFYAIPAQDKDARDGDWCEGPGIAFFQAVEKKLGKVRIVAEDLGIINDTVRRLLDKSGFPGMKVLQFAFDQGSSNTYLPHNLQSNCVVYTGTHDNDTIEGWFAKVEKGTAAYAKKYMALTKEEGVSWGMIRTAFSTVAELAVVPVQDFLGLGSEARMNTPGTVKDNWEWRMADGALTDKLAARIHGELETYGRL